MTLFSTKLDAFLLHPLNFLVAQSVNLIERFSKDDNHPRFIIQIPLFFLVV